MGEKLSGFEATPDDIRKSAEDVKEAASDVPRDALRDVSRDIDYGNDEVAKAMGEFHEGATSAIQILRYTAEEAGMALRSIAAEYEGHDMKQSKELYSG